MSADSKSTDSRQNSSRRNFLKIGAGVVAGAAVASVVEIPYYSSVIGGNNNSSSTTVSSLHDQLSTTQSQLADTQGSLSATQSSLSQAQGTISSLNSQLTATQSSLSSANGQLSSANSELSNVQSSLTAANSQNATLSNQLSASQSALTSANGQVTTLSQQLSSTQQSLSTASSQAASLQTQIQTVTGFVNLNVTEQACVAAMAAMIIPTDSNGPGATTAGSIYFIDRQLGGDYGKNAQMYFKGPFVYPGLTTPVTIAGTTYSAGSMIANPTDGSRYQYGLQLREFWRSGILAFETYCGSAYGGNFETLSAANQLKALTDLTTNKPTSFNDIVPSDFFNEVFFMTWSGFLMDPLYGGNIGMVGWELTGFSGVNMGNFYGEGHTSQELMLMTTPLRLKPASLAQFQAAAKAGT
jgi:gluconate 2-dehydrogenase gamma chain